MQSLAICEIRMQICQTKHIRSLYPRLHFGFLLSNVCTSIFPETVCNVRKVHRIPRTCEWMELVGFDGTSECSFMQKFALCAPSFHQR